MARYIFRTMPTLFSDAAATSFAIATGSRDTDIEPQRAATAPTPDALQHAILASATFPIIATDENGIIQLFNRGAERMLGYAAADVVNGLSPTHICDPLEVIARAVVLSREFDTPIAPGFAALVFKAQRRIEDNFDLTWLRKDGSRLATIVSVSALRDADDRTIGYLLSCIGSAERAQAEDQVRRAEETFRLMVDGVTDCGIVMLDPGGHVSSWNQGAQAIEGYGAAEVIGQHFSRFYDAADIARGEPRRDLDIATAWGHLEVEGWRVRKDGSTFWAGVALNAIRDPAGALRGFTRLTRDLTGRRLVEADLMSATASAEKVSLAKSDFLSGMGHELRTSLNAILGFAQVMQADTASSDATRQENVAQILQAGWYLMALIDQILDLASIESERRAWSLAPMSLTEVMQECQAMIEPLAQISGVRLTFPATGERYLVRAERARVKQVLMHLLTNAVRHNQVGGAVVVDCAAGTGHSIRVSVSDTGPGLPPAMLERLFQPFDAFGPVAGSGESMGISLLRTRRVIELMGGAIGAASSEGKGSLFWIELVAAPVPSTPAGAAGAGQAADARVQGANQQRTLLYVEDNPANMQLVEQIIARRPDMLLLGATSAAQGLELAGVARPDVILMDVNLPGMSGIDAMRILRADPATAHIPVLALSASATPRDIERGLQAGFFRYLTKPIKVNAFLETLDGALMFAENQAHQTQ